MTSRPGTARRGHSLVELLVALGMLGVVLAVVLGTTLRSWRTHTGLAARAAARAQLEAAALALVTDLRALSAAAGDLPDGGARDTALELRAFVTAATLCDTSGGELALLPLVAPDGPAPAASTVPDVGDSAWTLEGDSIWKGARVEGARRVGARCGGAAIEVTLSPGWPAPEPGMPVRVTRRTRWSLYRGGDSQWYLGHREWNATLGRFDVVQPVAGPLAPAGPAPGLELHYLDSTGAPVAGGSDETRHIARVDIALRARAAGAGRDSLHMTIALGRGGAQP